MGTTNRVRVSIGLDKKHVPSFSEGAGKIHKKISANAGIFESPPVSMEDLGNQIKELNTAQLAMTTDKGAGSVRDASLQTVWRSLETLCLYVQHLCDLAGDGAMVIAEASGFHVVIVSKRVKDILEVALTHNTGEVTLKAFASALEGPAKKKSGSRTYLWRFTLDSKKSYVNAEPTPVSHTTITGLPLMTEVGFEVAVKDSTGTSPYTQTVFLHIHPPPSTTAKG